MTSGLKRLAEMRKKVAAETSEEVDSDVIVVEREPEKKVAKVVPSDRVERYRRVMEEASRLVQQFGWDTENATWSDSPNPFPTRQTHLFGLSVNGHTLTEIVFSFNANGEMLMRFYASSQNTNLFADGGVGAFNRYLTQVANANAIISRLIEVSA